MRAILTFHSIDTQGSVLSYRPDSFRQLLTTLADKRIPVVDLDTLLQPVTRDGVAITFDDGMQSVLQHALPVLRDFDAPAHLYLCTGAVDQGNPWPRDPCDGHTFDMLDWDGVEALHAGGVHVECHTHSHPDMRTLSAAQMLEECGRADTLIETRLGRRPQHFAYPYGYHDPGVREFARERYATTVTTELRPLSTANDRAALPRLDSYYLQSARMIHGIGSFGTNSYLALRNQLRNLRGSQCRANCD